MILGPIPFNPKVKFGYGYRYNGQEWQDELGLNMTAMDYRQYDNAIGRFNSVDALSEMQYSHTPYHFGYGNPIFWADPTGLLSQNFINSIWDNSASSGWTVWTNSHSGFFSDNHGRGIVDSETGFFTPSVSLSQVEITLHRNNWGGAGALAQSHVYNNSPFYESLRADSRSRNMDSFQSGLDYIGAVPGFGEIADGLNAVISLFRGDYTGAGLSALAMVPFAGNMATVVKIQKHHIIPKAVYKKMGGELSEIMKLNGGFNLKKLPAGFHGNHPQYSNYVTDRLMDMKREGVLSPGSIQALQKDLNGMINQAYDNYKATGENLNDYFRKLNGN